MFHSIVLDFYIKNVLELKKRNVQFAADWYAKAANKGIKAGDQHFLIVQFPGP
jgi:TPR repeat protein